MIRNIYRRKKKKKEVVLATQNVVLDFSMQPVNVILRLAVVLATRAGLGQGVNSLARAPTGLKLSSAHDRVNILTISDTQYICNRHDALGTAGTAAAAPEFFQISSVHR